MEVQELSRLKADIFQSNLAVHRLMAEDGLETAELATLEAAREAVISLYSLWAEASSALSLRKEAEQLRNREAEADRPKKRRRKQRLRPKEEEKRDGRITASPDDSGYSEAASGADPRADSRLEVVALGEGRLYLTKADLEAKQVMAADGGAPAVAGGISMGWLGRVGRVALYSCLLVAAILPLAMYGARPPQCCEFMYPTPHWIHLQYVNGPPPI